MSQKKTHAGKNRFVTTLAVVLIVVGTLAFAVPLIWQRINYGIAARKAAEAEAQMVIPDQDAYQTVDYSTLEKGDTPVYSPSEMEEAASPPSLLEEFGIVGQPSSFQWLFPAAMAESTEPASMRDALNQGAQALEECAGAPYDQAKVAAALAVARKQVENSFFLLTMVQPITNTEKIAALENQKAADGLTRGDKIITAAREMIYATLTELEAILKQVEDAAASVAAGGPADVPARESLFAQMDTLSSYLRMMALHLPEDDYKADMAQHKEIAALEGQDKKEEADQEDESGYAAIDVDPPGVTRSYLLEIPDIGLKVAVYRSGSFNKMYVNMRSGAAMFPRAPEPNTVGNLCISAHRTGTRDYFRNLDKLSVGDTIYMHTSQMGSFQYEVVKVAIIERNDWSVTAATSYPALTLLSCQAYGGISNAQRIMVRAKLVAVANGK